MNSRKTTKNQQGKKPVPPQLVGKGFDAHPEHINKKGAPKGYADLRKLILEKGEEVVTVMVRVPGKKGKQAIQMTRIEKLIYDQMDSTNPLKQQIVMGYGFGAIPKHEQALGVEKDADKKDFAIPAELIAPDFLVAHRRIKEHAFTEYLFKGGRGSTKSSFISLEIIALIKNNPGIHGLVTRKVQNTLRDSVYAQLVWAIGELGLSDEFNCTVSPMQIEYIPTGQIIYFRGADDPGKIKSIKPGFGYIGIIWFEELDQFAGPETVRKIEQSAMRGGDLVWVFKSYNPPPTSGNWANKYAQIPKDNQYQHLSSYLTVPPEWLGQAWLDEAKHLKEVNPDAYEHEYLGVVNQTGGQVFNNLTLRRITDEEIAQFDNVKDGLDFGWYPDPAHYIKCHYDKARLTLYIYVELKAFKKSNAEMYEAIKGVGYRDDDTLICDSAEPKSVADYVSYGARARGAEKGPDSVKYSYKWLQSLKSIVIDNVRCPHAAQEFTDAAYEQDPDGNFISEFDDSTGDHSIAATRYATNLIWRRKGQ